MFMIDFFSNDAFQSSPNLPSDVLRDIFEFYIDNYHHDKSRPLSPKDVPWFLGHVCRLWRAAAIATPQLWNRFPPLKLTVEKRSCHPMFDELLRRSGVRPIRVHLNFALDKGDAGLETYPALEPLIAASKRWEEVIIRGLNVQHMEYQLRKIEGQIPHLRRVLLSFGRHASDVDQVAGPTSIFRDAPVLSELLVDRLSLSVWQRFPVISWKQLNRYEDAKGSCGGPYEILKRAENLETLITTDCDFQKPDQSLLVHSKLCQFQAHVTRTQVSFLALLDKLKLPNLRNLTVTFDPISTAPELHAAPTLTSLLTRSQCNLRTLVLNQGPLHDFEVSEMLAATPRLEALELGDCATLDRVLLSLVFKKMENTLLPYLRNLTFVFPGTLRHRHIKAILQIVESRNKQVRAEDELSLGCLFVPLQNVRITVHEFAFRFKACLDLNKKFSGNDIEASMSAIEQQAGDAYLVDGINREYYQTLLHNFINELDHSNRYHCHGADRQLERQATDVMRLLQVICSESSSTSSEFYQMYQVCQSLVTNNFIKTCEWMLIGPRDIVYIPPDHELRESSDRWNIAFGMFHNDLQMLKGYCKSAVLAERRLWWE